MVPSGARYREGMEGTSYPASHPYVSSYLFLLPIYDAPSSAERREKIGEEERKRRKQGERKRERKKCRRRDGLSIFIMFALKKKRCGGGRMGGPERKKWKQNERERERGTVGIYAWKARAARKNLQPRAACKGPTKKKSEKNVPPNQCSRPTELIPAKGFFVASIFSTRFRWNASRPRARTAFPYQSATNQPSMPGISRAMNAAQFFIIFNTSVRARVFVLRVYFVRRTMAKTQYAICARVREKGMMMGREGWKRRNASSPRRYPQAKISLKFWLAVAPD